MERLQKVMADAGIASRRHCEEIILEGRVMVNGKVVTDLPFMVDKTKDRIVVDERRIRFDHKVYYLLNKPTKVICTNYDPSNRRRTVDLLPGVRERVYPVGRLDADSQGLVLMTNDGDLANELTHPKYGVPKKYIVEVATCIEPSDIEKLIRGFHISHSGRASMDKVKVLKRERKYSLLEITLREGRNRQIRKMLARLGHKVRKLTRVSFGPLELKGVGVGNYRPLLPVEVTSLKKSIAKYKAMAKTDSQAKPKPRTRLKASEESSGPRPQAVAKKTIKKKVNKKIIKAKVKKVSRKQTIKKTSIKRARNKR